MPLLLPVTSIVPFDATFPALSKKSARLPEISDKRHCCDKNTPYSGG
jgi:hypothetical protein